MTYYRAEYWNAENGGHWVFLGFYSSPDEAAKAAHGRGSHPRVIEIEENEDGHFETEVNWHQLTTNLLKKGIRGGQE